MTPPPPLSPVRTILPPRQRRLWRSLAPLSELGFVLYGGTAIALRLGHRESVDFDFFTMAPLDRSILERDLPFLRRGRLLQEAPNTLVLLVGRRSGHEVKVSLFGGLGVGRVGHPQATEDGVLLVASPLDLLATKLKVLLQRIESKDYRDIAALLRSGQDLAHGLAAARCLYGRNFQPAECLKALTHFVGGDLASLGRSDRRDLIAAATAVRRLPQIRRKSRDLAPAPGSRP